MSDKYRANFLWPVEVGSIEHAGYEFANGEIEDYQEYWWGILLERIRAEVPKETCICAAVKTMCGLVVRGHRHIHRLEAIQYKAKEPDIHNGQGFVTSTGCFVTREEGYELQIAAGIESIAKGGYRGERLFSEDLY